MAEASLARRHANGDGAQAAGFALSVPPDVLTPLVRAVVAEVLAATDAARAALPDGRLAYGEAEAARLLGLHAHQLRGERRLNRVRASRGPGGKILYTREALLNYLASRPWEGGK